MNNKGFIPIIFIVIITAVLASATAGFVYKDKVTEVFKKEKAVVEIVEPIVEPTEEEPVVEEPTVEEPKPKFIEKIIEKFAKKSEPEIQPEEPDEIVKLENNEEESKLAEQEELEAEKKLVEERARQRELEKEIERQAEELRKQEEEAQEERSEKVQNESEPIVEGSSDEEPIVEEEEPVVEENVVLSAPIGDVEIGTAINSIISQDTIWTLEGSPYIVTSNILITERTNLTIEPGVIIKFKEGKFEILNKGNIIAKGNPTNKIVFTSIESNPQSSGWKTIKTIRGSINFDNVEIKYASYGVTATYSSNVIITNSYFSNNGTAIFVAGPATISNNIIENNKAGINYYGSEGEKIEITYNTIRNNRGQGLGNPYQAGIVIQDVRSSGYSLVLRYNDIYDNDTGIKFSNSDNLSSLLMKNNNIYNHSDLNIWFNSSGDENPKIDMSENWWGATDASIIDSSFYDYHDNFNLGEIIYQPIITSKISNAGVK